MALAMARPGKHPKTGVYWLRKRVPDELRALVGKQEEKRSLGTKDPAEAKLQHAEALLYLLRLVLPLAHSSILQMPNGHTSGRTTLQGAGQTASYF